MSKFIFLRSSPIVQALYEAGVIAEDVETIRRVVIDLKVGSAARVYVDRYADDEELAAGLIAGIELAESEADAGRVGHGAPKRKDA